MMPKKGQYYRICGHKDVVGGAYTAPRFGNKVGERRTYDTCGKLPDSVYAGCSDANVQACCNLFFNEQMLREIQNVNATFPESRIGQLYCLILKGVGLLGKIVNNGSISRLFFNRLVPDVVFYQHFKDKEKMFELYKSLFYKHGVCVKCCKEILSLRSHVSVMHCPVVHVLSPVEHNPVSLNCVKVSVFEFDGSSNVAECASKVSSYSYGYDAALYADNTKTSFFLRFYEEVLKGVPVADAYGKIKAESDFPPKQYIGPQGTGAVRLFQNRKNRTGRSYD